MVSGKKTLNAEQLQAIKQKSGPLLIIAGAGTGKTTVITERIKYLIEKNFCEPSEILALTFTEKAAAEMQERIDVALPYGYTQMWISTFHSFCDRVLKNEALQIGLNTSYKLNSQSESIQFFRNNLFKFKLSYFRPLGNPTKFISGMLQHFSRLSDEDVTAKDYLDWVKKLKAGKSEEEKIEIEKWRELANAYQKYDELKASDGVMDFGDLISKTLELFRRRKNVLKEYQKRFKYILVDEFQDTNISQNELVKLLAGKIGNITVVLDDDQSIYRFRGAAVSNALYFRKNFLKAKVVTLVKNYRSSQDILDKAYKLIQFNNPDRLEVIENIDKKLVSQVKYPEGEIKFIHKDRVENEAEEVAKKIKDITKDKRFNFGDIAILVRANNHADPFVRALARNGIPHQFLGPGRLFKQPEIVDLISFLKIMYDFEDSVSMYRLLSIEYFEIEARDLIKLTNYAKWKNLTLFDACEKVEDIFLSDETREKIKKLIKVISDQQKLVNKESAGQLLYNFLNETGLILKLLNPDTPLSERRAKNISKFFDKLRTYEVDHEDASVRTVVDWIDLASELGESPLAADSDWTENNAVNILTVHSSKGLEFPVVFLVNLVGQRFPSSQRSEQIPISDELVKEVLPKGDYHIEEERRLFYVGMTRAKEKLFFTAADYYGEGKREKKLSPFIFEALGDDVLGSESSEVRGEQLSFMSFQPPSEKKKLNEAAPFHIDYLSYSQIETFRICPLHYKLKYIYKLPTPTSSAQSFGTSIHGALRDFYRVIKTGEKPTEKLLLELLDKNWVNEGYQSKNHEEKSKKRGVDYLIGYYKNGFDIKTVVEGTEVSFTLPLVNSSEQPLKVGGRIDRIDALHDGKIELIDYKTSEKPPTQKDMDKNKDIGRQLAFYALAATNIKEKPFNKKPDEIKLSFYFFETQTKVSTVRSAEQLEEAKEEIFKAREEIESSEFKCSNNMLCDKCEFKLFCTADEQ